MKDTFELYREYGVRNIWRVVKTSGDYKQMQSIYSDKKTMVWTNIN